MAHRSPTHSILVAGVLFSELRCVTEEDRLVMSTSLLNRLGLTEGRSSETAIDLAACLDGLSLEPASKRRPLERFVDLAGMPEAASALNVHEFNGIKYFNKERFEALLAAALCQGALVEDQGNDPEPAKRISEHYDAYRRLLQLMSMSEYDWTDFGKRIRRIRRRKKSKKNIINNAKTST